MEFAIILEVQSLKAADSRSEIVSYNDFTEHKVSAINLVKQPIERGFSKFSP